MTAPWMFCKLNKLFYKLTSNLLKVRPLSRKQYLCLKLDVKTKQDRSQQICSFLLSVESKGVEHSFSHIFIL